jgi:hypothetical protein
MIIIIIINIIIRDWNSKELKSSYHDDGDGKMMMKVMMSKGFPGKCPLFQESPSHYFLVHTSMSNVWTIMAVPHHSCTGYI